MILTNQKGQAMIETMIAMVIGLISTYAMVSYLVDLNAINGRLKLQRLSREAIQAYAENIRYDTSLFQVTFDNSGSAEAQILAPAKLPLGITGESSVIQRADCAKLGCLAYMGYVIIPHEFIRNLYEVKFVVINSSNESAKWETSYYITVK